MLHFTNPDDLDARDEFLDDTDFDQNDWDSKTMEDMSFVPEDDNWSQAEIDEFDDLDDLGDLDDFSGVF